MPAEQDTVEIPLEGAARLCWETRAPGPAAIPVNSRRLISLALLRCFPFPPDLSPAIPLL